MKRPYVFLTLIAAGIALAAADCWDFQNKYKGRKFETTDSAWHPDILQGYEARFVNQGEAFDGPCRSTIIRKSKQPSSSKGYLYVHGFNDYFFQAEMGDIFVDSGFQFYAVDLRRYGRSRQPWQYPFNVRNLKEYFADIDSAISQMQRDGISDITLGGHSTGGLTVLYYAAEKGARCRVKRIVTDSPFLEWNFNATYRNFLLPLVGAWGHISPDTKIKQSHCDGYAESLLKNYHGQWTYDTCWKMIYSPPVTAGWINAISSAQKNLIKHRKNIVVPMLVMHSSRQVKGCDWNRNFQYGDAVLSPEMIRQRGEKLGAVVCSIDSGLHDLILSEEPHRTAAYNQIFRFINSTP